MNLELELTDAEIQSLPNNILVKRSSLPDEMDNLREINIEILLGFSPQKNASFYKECHFNMIPHVRPLVVSWMMISHKGRK